MVSLHVCLPPGHTTFYRHQPRTENATVMCLPLTLIYKCHLGSHSTSLGLSFIIYKVGVIFFAKLLGKPNIKHRGGAIIIISEPQSLPGTITVQGHQDSLTQSEFHSGKKKSDDTFKSDAQGGLCSGCLKDPEPKSLPFYMLSTRCKYHSDYLGSSEDA